MKHLSILIPKGNLILDTIVGTLNLFRMANHYAKKKGMMTEDLFKIDLVSIDKEEVLCHQYFQINPTASIDEIHRTDLIIISSITGDLESTIALNEPIISWIRNKRVTQGTEIVSLCRSAFLLAETGLLNNKSCTTHWAVKSKFINRFPKVNLRHEKVISEDAGIYSSGGAYSFLNMIVYLIERYYGREVAIWCSKMAEIDFDRIDQNQFAVFSGQKDHNDEAVKTSQDYIEQNYTEKISVDELANRVSMSTRSFMRRFKNATHNTPFEYVQRVKVEAAKKSFETSTLNINEVMYNVGYNDVKSFRKVFKKYTGLSPLDYRRKYNRDMVMTELSY